MTILLGLLGVLFGSFVNALVWRLHEQSTGKKKRNLSITRGRSMCPHCRHELAAKDLIPVLSWLLLGRKCRYCQKPISGQYPLVELATGLLFGLSYAFWPLGWGVAGTVNFAVWLVLVVCFMALLVYDLRWMLLPNRLMYPLLVLGLLLALFNIAATPSLQTVLETVAGVAVAGGIFYLLFMVSDGRWIGGGDVKLGALIGLVLASPYLAFLVLLTASTLGTLVILPGMLLKKLTPASRIPFGPFLIIGVIVVQLFGRSVIEWYKRSVLLQG